MVNRYKFNEEKHIHSLDGKNLYGTTTVLGIIGKPLTWWASSMACGELGWLAKNKDKFGNDIPFKDKERLAERQIERLVSAGVKLTEVKLMTVQEYLNLLDLAYRAHNAKKEARAQEGTDLHELAEKWIRYCLNVHNGIPTDPLLIEPQLVKFVEWCKKNVKRFLFAEIHCYSEKLWVGGKTDFGYEDMEGNFILADIKSREKVYFSDFVQCGGYALQLGENGGFDKDGKNIWQGEREMFGNGLELFHRHAIFPLTDKFTEPVISKDVGRHRKAFECALGLYKEKQYFEEVYG